MCSCFFTACMKEHALFSVLLTSSISPYFVELCSWNFSKPFPCQTVLIALIFSATLPQLFGKTLPELRHNREPFPCGFKPHEAITRLLVCCFSVKRLKLGEQPVHGFVKTGWGFQLELTLTHFPFHRKCLSWIFTV